MQYSDHDFDTADAYDLMIQSGFDQVENDYYKYCVEKQFQNSSSSHPTNYRLITYAFIVPFYHKAYDIIHNELLNALINYDINDDLKINQLMNELQSSFSNLNGTLLLARMVLNDNELSKTPESIRYRRYLESTIDSHEKCINNLKTYKLILLQELEDIMKRSDEARTTLVQYITLYNEAKQKHADCWYFCENSKNEMNSFNQQVLSNFPNIFVNDEELRKATKEFIKLTKTIDHYVGELNLTKIDLSLDQQQQSAFDKITENFKQLYDDLQSITIYSNRSDDIFKMLCRIESVIIKLHKIDDIARENLWMPLSSQPFITDDDFNKAFLKIIQLQYVLQRLEKHSSAAISSTLSFPFTSFSTTMDDLKP